MGIMLPQDGGRKTGHLATNDIETGGLEPAQHGAHEALFHAVRLKDNKRLLHKY